MQIKAANFWLLISLFIAVNLIIVAMKPIYLDPAMYWLYGQHLSLVYFDAPPLVAFITRGATALFGVQAWVITALSLGFVLASAYYLYSLAVSSYNKMTAQWVTLVWLFTPAITHIYIRFNWGYNNLLMFFWIMSMYYFYQAQKTQRPHHFYLCALGVALAVLSHFEAFFLILSIIAILLFSAPYRKLLRNPHIYLASLLFLAIITPYIYSLFQTHFQSIFIQFQFHATNNASLVSFSGFLNFLNDIINDLNLFFILGCVLLIKNYQKIHLKFFVWWTLVIFIPFFILSFHTTFPMKYYMPFYYGFILASIPLMTNRGLRYLKWILWINILLFLLQSWNVIIPRFGISPGGNIFYQQNLQKIAQQIQPLIKSGDLLIGCARDAHDINNQNDYSAFAVLAFYLQHTNSYTTMPGFFSWQAPIAQVLAQHHGGTVFYLCENYTPPALPNLVCEPTHKITVVSHQWQQKMENSWYLQRCRVED